MRFRHFIVLVMGWALAVSTAYAHLIVSQRGTLNIVGDGAFMVLSLPVSAFLGVDDNADGLLSTDELRAHKPKIEAQIKSSVILENSQGFKSLNGLMLTTTPPENDHTAPAKQIVVLGRFGLEPESSDLKLTMRLFGIGTDERTEHITVTQGSRSQLITLTPDRPSGDVLPSVWHTLAQQMKLGAEHILLGVDHLLFLLVVLAAGLSLRHVVFALTCFTAGHALTLVACTWFGFSVSAKIVEPVIAATIVGMAWFDLWSSQRCLKYINSIRLSLIFACALIHGLGLASALTDLGLDPTSKALNLLGFNVGIEFAQIGVALIVVFSMFCIKSLWGNAGLAWLIRAFYLVATGLGSFWLLERTLNVS
jgi:HupE / UreJ protein